MLDYFIMRHGPTERVPAKNDALRQLTAAGHSLVAQIGTALQRRHIRLAHILHSPVLRAQQSAMALASTQPQAALKSVAALAPGGSVGALSTSLEGTRGAVLTISHLPDVCSQLAWCTGNEAHRNVFFEAASIAYLQAPLWEPGIFILRWHLSGEALIGSPSL